MKFIPEINMPQEVLELATSDLLSQEGERLKPYYDQYNNITVGRGYNLTSRGMPREWSIAQEQEDINYAYNKILNTFIWYKNLNMTRQVVLIDMAFMGIKKLFEFKKMFYYLSINDFSNAAKEMLNSEWAKQLPARAQLCAHRMLTGIYTLQG